MKRANLLFALITSALLAYGVYLNNYAYGGADGLSNFFPLVIVLILSLGGLIAFFATLFLDRESSTLRKIVLTVVALVVVLKFLVSIGMFSSYTNVFDGEVLERIE